jgi:hypothetical protein
LDCDSSFIVSKSNITTSLKLKNNGILLDNLKPKHVPFRS